MNTGRADVGKIRAVGVHNRVVVVQIEIIHWHRYLHRLQPNNARASSTCGGSEVHAKRIRKLFVMDNMVAFACARLEPDAVEDHNTAASVPDQALCLHPLRPTASRSSAGHPASVP